MIICLNKIAKKEISMVVAFFGHKDAGADIKPKIKEVVKDLIENHQADIFLVGNNGSFDSMVKSVLAEAEKFYPHVKYNVVLAYHPVQIKENDDYSHTVFPEGLEKVPVRFAISKRNELMIKQSQTVVAYVTRSYGGAYKFKTIAEKKGKKVINIADITVEAD